jgi:hypothetical protein
MINADIYIMSGNALTNELYSGRQAGYNLNRSGLDSAIEMPRQAG